MKKTKENSLRLKFRQYLLTLVAFFLSDILWGFFYEQRWLILTYSDTCLFFAFMALSVLFWTRGVVAFSGKNDKPENACVKRLYDILLRTVADTFQRSGLTEKNHYCDLTLRSICSQGHAGSSPVIRTSASHNVRRLFCIKVSQM